MATARLPLPRRPGHRLEFLPLGPPRGVFGRRLPHDVPVLNHRGQPSRGPVSFNAIHQFKIPSFPAHGSIAYLGR